MNARVSISNTAVKIVASGSDFWRTFIGDMPFFLSSFYSHYICVIVINNGIVDLMLDRAAVFRVIEGKKLTTRCLFQFIQTSGTCAN